MGKSKLYLKQIPNVEDLLDFLEEKYKRINPVKKFFEKRGLDRAELLKEDIKKFMQLIGKEKKILAEFIAEKNELQKNKEILKKIEEDILPSKRCNYKKKISQSQIRKHYNYFLDVCQDVEYKGWKEEEHLVKLAMEKVYINYDFARDNVNYLFKRFVEDLIDEVKDEETLRNAQVLFEALVGYSKVFIEK